MTRHFRFAAPIAALSIVALAPVWLVASRARPATELGQIASSVTLAWVLVAIAIVAQLALAGAAYATRDARSQLDAVGRGGVGLARAIVPCGFAAVAIALGCLALALPGLVLAALLATTGAAAQDGPGTPSAVLARAIAGSRPRLAMIASLVAAMLAVDASIVLVAHRLWLVFPDKPSADDLAASVTYVHAVALALVVTAPVFAMLLAAQYRSPTTARPASE